MLTLCCTAVFGWFFRSHSRNSLFLREQLEMGLSYLGVGKALRCGNRACCVCPGWVWFRLRRCSPTSDASPIEGALGLGGVSLPACLPGVLLPREPGTLTEKSAMGLTRDFLWLSIGFSERAAFRAIVRSSRRRLAAGERNSKGCVSV